MPIEFQVEVTRSSNGSVDLRPARGPDGKPQQSREGDAFASPDGLVTLSQLSNAVLGKNLKPGEVYKVTLEKVADAPPSDVKEPMGSAAHPLPSVPDLRATEAATRAPDSVRHEPVGKRIGEQ